MALTAAFGETVEYRGWQATSARGVEGNAAGSWGAWQSIPNCRVGTDASTERAGALEQQTATSYRVRFPVGFPVSPRGQVRRNGVIYDVDGEPLQARSAFTAFDPGPLVSIIRNGG